MPGTEVITLSRRGEDNVENLDRLIATHNFRRPQVMKADVSDRVRLLGIAEELRRNGTQLETIVGCAGINKRMLTLDVTDEAIRLILDINLYGFIATFRFLGRLHLSGR